MFGPQSHEDVKSHEDLQSHEDFRVNISFSTSPQALEEVFHVMQKVIPGKTLS